MEVNQPNKDWNNQQQIVPQDNKKVACGILAILLGPFGIHKFLLG